MATPNSNGIEGSAYHLKPRLADDAATADEISLPVLAGRAGNPAVGLPNSLAGVVAREELLGVM